MRQKHVYVDNSVFGGVHDEEFAEASKRFLDQVRSGKYVALVSQIVYQELADAPRRVQEVLESLPSGTVAELPLDEDVKSLASEYIRAGALGPASINDATQVALAAVAGIKLIVSWNFKHLVNYERIQKFNAVNLLNGYGVIDIRSPQELNDGDQDEDL